MYVFIEWSRKPKYTHTLHLTAKKRMRDLFKLNPSTQMYKGFYWFTVWFLPIRFDFNTVPNVDSGQQGLTLQLFPTTVTSNLVGQNRYVLSNENALYNLVQ